MNEIYIDIETIPTQRQDLRDYIAATIKPPATIKLPASIAKWHTESKAEAIDEAVSKTGLDGAFGQVCVIGWAIGDGQAYTVHSADDERSLLFEFNRFIDNVIAPSMHSAMTVVGHNILAFDLRFLVQRCMVHGIKPHPIISTAAKAKAWDNSVYDTMTQWNPDRDKRISLDKLCTALGVPSPKGEIDGSMVGQYVADGRIAEVAEYCRNDVIATRAVYKRMTFA